MKKRDKLVLAGLGSLALCFAIAPLLKSDDRDAPVLRPDRVERQAKQNKMLQELQSAEAPPEMETTKQYLKKRFAGLEDPGEAGRGIEVDGQEYFLEPEIRVGKGPGGKTYYAKAWSMPMRFDGPKLTVKDAGKAHSAALRNSAGLPGAGGFLGRNLDGMKPVPLGQAPGGLFGSKKD